MARQITLIALLASALSALAIPAHAESDDHSYEIMKPEKPPAKELAPKQTQKARRGSSTVVFPAPLPRPLHYNPQPPPTVSTQPAAVPPSLYVPRTGQTLQNLPTVAPSGPKGTETYQDRAVRCAHQAGVYGQAAGDRNAYIGSCINQ